MEISWMQSLLYGFISGLTEFLPVSSETHRMLFMHLTGIWVEPPVLRLCVRLFSALGLVLACQNTIMRLRYEQRLAAIPPRRRRRNPDTASILELRMVKSAAVPMLIGLVFYIQLNKFLDLLWLQGLVLILNGIVLYLPQFMLRGNKDSRSMSGADALAVGLSGALSVIPGVSRIGLIVSAARMRGADKRFAVEIALLLSVPMLLGLCLLDFFAMISAEATASFLHCLTASVAAFGGSYFSVQIIRYFGKKPGFTAFSYYSWGAAFLALILYLTII